MGGRGQQEGSDKVINWMNVRTVTVKRCCFNLFINLTQRIISFYNQWPFFLEEGAWEWNRWLVKLRSEVINSLWT